MNKNFLILVTVAFSLLIGGCDQPLPPSDNSTPPTEKTAVTQPEEKPLVNPNPTEKPPVNPEPVKDINTEPPKVVSPAVQNQKISVKIYYPDDAGINLVAVKRNIEIQNDSEKYLAAVQLLMQNPKEKDLTVIFPKNAKINSVKVENGTAFVDLDKNIKKSFAGGSTGEELLVNSVVQTLTEFKEVKQVKFLIDGAEVETLSGHMDLSEPIKKTDL